MNLPSLMSAGSVRQRDKRLSGSYRLSMGDLAVMEVPSDQDRLSLGRFNKVLV